MARRSRRQRGGESDALRNAREAYDANVDDMTIKTDYIKVLYDELGNTVDNDTITSLKAILRGLGADPERPPPDSKDLSDLGAGGGRRRRSRQSRRPRRPIKSRRSRRPRKSRRSRRSRRRH